MRVLFFLFLLLLVSCSPETGNGGFTVTSWNAYCFFDGVGDGSEYTEFLSSSGYTREKYTKRVDNAALYMASNMKDSDVIILEEIESEDVLSDLLEAGLKGAGFRYYGLAQKSDGELSVGFLSKIKPSSYAFHSTQSSRVILELKFIVGGEMITVFGVHLKSQLNESSSRLEELSLIRTLVERRDGECIIVIGDFNTDCLTGSEMGDRKRKEDYALFLTGDGSEAYGGTLFSPYLDYGGSSLVGSYYYDGDWYTYDNALLSSTLFDGRGLEYDSFAIVSGALSKTSSGTPLKYEKSTGNGFSDHFAITLRLRYT